MQIILLMRKANLGVFSAMMDLRLELHYPTTDKAMGIIMPNGVRHFFQRRVLKI